MTLYSRLCLDGVVGDEGHVCSRIGPSDEVEGSVEHADRDCWPQALCPLWGGVIAVFDCIEDAVFPSVRERNSIESIRMARRGKDSFSYLSLRRPEISPVT